MQELFHSYLSTSQAPFQIQDNLLFFHPEHMGENDTGLLLYI